MATEEPKEPPDETADPDTGESAGKPAIPSVKKKVPEPPGNLRQREEWLRKRTDS